MGEVKPFTVATDKKWSITDGIKAFKIRTEYPDNSKPTGTWITFPNADDKYWNVPQMLLLPKGWEWPIERADIRDAYPDFRDWVANKETNEWINSKVNGLTHRRNQ